MLGNQQRRETVRERRLVLGGLAFVVVACATRRLNQGSGHRPCYAAVPLRLDSSSAAQRLASSSVASRVPPAVRMHRNAPRFIAARTPSDVIRPLASRQISPTVKSLSSFNVRSLRVVL